MGSACNYGCSKIEMPSCRSFNANTTFKSSGENIGKTASLRIFLYTAALSICNHSDKVVSSHLDKSVRIWSLAASESVATNTEHHVGQRSDYHQILAMSKIDQRLFTGSFDGHLTIWDTRHTQPTKLHQIRCGSKAISVIRPHKEGGKMMVYVGCEDGTLYSVEVRNMQGTKRLHIVDTNTPLQVSCETLTLGGLTLLKTKIFFLSARRIFLWLHSLAGVLY